MAQLDIKITPEMIGLKCLPGSDAYKVAMIPLREAAQRLEKAAEQFEEATGFRLALEFEISIPPKDDAS